MGKRVEMELKGEDVKLIKADHHIAGQVTNLFKKWHSPEQERRPDRASRTTLQRKQDQLIADLEVPFNVAKADARRSSRTRASRTGKRSGITCRTS